MSTYRRKLIEVSLPLEAINAAAAREKSIRHGHPSTLHLWWARRPLAACRAVLFAQLVDDPSAWPEHFPTETAQEAERKRLHTLLGGTKERAYKDGLVAWESSNNEDILNAARWEIARSVAWNRGEEPPPKNDPQAVLAFLQEKAPPVYDPFCGGGSIPLEAQRLGLRAYGSDLNPVAVLISKALVEIPPKFAGLPPVNPEARRKLGQAGSWNGRGARGLAEDVRYYGRWMREEAERRIGHLYPKARLPDGSEATVIAWIWARTVRSPDPAAKGAMVPLASNFLLSTKEGRKAWVEPVRDPAAPDGYRFEVHTGALAKGDEERLKKGTKAGRGANFVCVLTGSAISGDWIKAEGRAGRMGARLMAIVAEGARGRIYLAPTPEHERIAAELERPEVPEIAQELPKNPRWFSPPDYGMPTYDQLFTPRQLVALTTFSDLVAAAREKALADARAAGLPDDPAPLAAGGTGAAAYADAVATYLAFAVSRATDFWCSNATWEPSGAFVCHVFTRQAIPMVWDFVESNPFSGASGNWLDTCVEWVPRAIGSLGVTNSVGQVTQVATQRNQFTFGPVVFSTDPPYYSNIGYADLADYFYIWLRRSIYLIWPDLFRRLLVPKTEELVATPYRHGSKPAAEKFFMEGMSAALNAIRGAAIKDYPLSIYYAFKQSEAAEEGLSSAGWAAFLQAVVDAGLMIDGTWPLRTERSARTVAMDTNALASSIVLVCRKRPDAAPVTTRAEFLLALKRELPDALVKIRAAGVQAVDFQQAAIGPGMGVFSRYARVLEADDSAMTVHTALALINHQIEELASEQDATYDADTQAALAWFYDYGWGERPAGDLVALATAKNTSVDSMYRAGVFKDLRGKARLLRRDELPAGWDPARDARLTVWEGAQHLAQVLDAEDGGIDAAASLHASLGARAGDVLALVYRLYQIADARRDAAEALVWNRLATEWPTIERRARELRAAAAPAQGVLV